MSTDEFLLKHTSSARRCMFSSFERSELDGNYAPSVSCVGVTQIT